MVIMTQKCSLCGRRYRTISRSGVKVGESDTHARRPADVDFERAVFKKIAGLDKSLSHNSHESSIAVKNARRPLKAIVVAGIQTAQEEPFCNRKYVKSLKFSKCWASGVLRRQLQQQHQQQQQSERTS